MSPSMNGAPTAAEAMRPLPDPLSLESVERGCAAEGHEPGACPIVRQLEAGAELCFEEEIAEAVLRVEDDWRPARYGGVTESPVVVVNARKVPVGYLKR